jgi:solute carrier family 39 (zinc transporter), member 1/2/3
MGNANSIISVSQSPSAAELLAAQPKTSGAALLPQTNQQSSQDSLQKEEGGGEEVRRDNTPTASFTQKFTTILILESGIIFHSIIIGLNLGTTSSEELTSLWIVLSFHQTFEGLGLGVRLAEIEFPKKKEWMKWALCVLYGLTTPVAIAAGLGLRRSYDAGSFEANVVSGVLDSISAGILIYTGLVEMLAKDFLFNSEMKTKGKREVGVLVFYVLLGAGLMALLAKWA